MEKKNLNSQANSNQKRNRSKSKRKADEELIEEAAERLAELFYEQCLSGKGLKRKGTGSLKRYRNNTFT